MFLDVLKRRNPKFVKAVVELHQKGELKSNSYVIDMDTTTDNTKIIKEGADKYGLNIYWMTKQINRPPAMLKMFSDIGSPKTVAVDIDGARMIVEHGGVVGHIGHLVNIPKNDIDWVLDIDPDIITVYSLQKAKDISDAAIKKGKVQDIMLRVIDTTNFFYPGQTGGTYLSELLDVIKELQKMKGVQLAGVTNFPSQLFDPKKKKVVFNENMVTILDAVDLIKSKTDIKLKQINMPGTTSSEILEMIAKKGGTHIEPGHGMTGTTPISIVKDTTELPSILYLTEVSHMLDDKTYIYGGGTWVDPVCSPPYQPDSIFDRGMWVNPEFPPYQMKGFVHRDPDSIFDQEVKAEFPSRKLIDYYADLMPDSGQDVRVNDSVIFCFRYQIFVNRSLVSIVSGIQSGHPKVVATYDVGGRQISR